MQRGIASADLGKTLSEPAGLRTILVLLRDARRRAELFADSTSGSMARPSTPVPSSPDADGDGIEDSKDSCPAVFNPIRPVDAALKPTLTRTVKETQGSCPLDADTTDCTPYNMNDSDGDGIANDADNCPNVANADQADADMDGKGDVRDSCPMTPNKGDLACPSTITPSRRVKRDGRHRQRFVTACVPDTVLHSSQNRRCGLRWSRALRRFHHPDTK